MERVEIVDPGGSWSVEIATQLAERPERLPFTAECLRRAMPGSHGLHPLVARALVRRPRYAVAMVVLQAGRIVDGNIRVRGWATSQER
jgi:hypothetical protein